MHKKISNLSIKIRNNILMMANKAGRNGAQRGGALSLVEVFATLFEGNYLNISSNNPFDKSRDRLVISKGHCVLAYYSVLYYYGFLSQNDIDGFETNGSVLHGHATRDVKRGIEFSGGSLGLGLSYAIGSAINSKISNLNYHVYSIIGDGECNEGIIWESLMTASHYKLDNLTVIVDDNKLQYDGNPKDVMNMISLKNKFESFGFFCINIDGHNIEELCKAFELNSNNKPKVIIANTIKGKGVSFMENEKDWHFSTLSDELYQNAISEQPNLLDL